MFCTSPTHQSLEGFLLHERFGIYWRKDAPRKRISVEIIQGIFKRLRI
jgi:hypothetical protein